MCMDFITIFLESQGYDAIFVMVDWFAKLAHMVLIVETAIVLELALAFSTRWWMHHMLPIVIVLDQDPKLTNLFYTHFSRKDGLKHRFSTAFCYQILGKMERVNEVLNQYLRNLVGVDQSDWADSVDGVGLICNVATYFAMKTSVFVMVYELHAFQPTILVLEGAHFTLEFNECGEDLAIKHK